MSEEMFQRDNDMESALSDKVQETDEETYLIFRSSNILYALNTQFVEEILSDVSITKVPMVPDYICGIINLRGQIMPVIDFRLLLGRFPEEDSCTITLNIEATELGLQVDSVDQMVNIGKSAILPVPSQNEHRMVTGMCTVGGGVGTVMILDALALVHINE